MTAEASAGSTDSTAPARTRSARGPVRAALATTAALLGVLFGALALPQAAYAADFKVSVANNGDPRLKVGGQPHAVTFKIETDFRPRQDPKDVFVNAQLGNLDDLAYIELNADGCTQQTPTQLQCPQMHPEGIRELYVTVRVTPSVDSDLQEGDTRNGQLTVTANDGSASTNVTVEGSRPARLASVVEITGTVMENAVGVDGAKVELTDGEGVTHETTTDAGGAFRFDGNDQNYIAPGDMKLVITKDGYEPSETAISVGPGSRFNQNLTIQAEEVEPTAETTTAAAVEPTEVPTSEAARESGGISGTLLTLIIVGALLVIGGIVGIVFLLRSGKDEESEDDESGFADIPPDHTPTAAQVGNPGVYQAGPAPGSDAPTMIHDGPLVQDDDLAGYGGQPAPGFGPAYGGSDATQVMPSAGHPGPYPPQTSDDTQILPTARGLANDRTQIQPQLPPQAPAGPFADRQPPPSEAPTSMFEPAVPGNEPQPPMSRDPYAPPSPSPYTPQPAPSDPYGSSPAGPVPGSAPDPYAQPTPQPPSDPYQGYHQPPPSYEAGPPQQSGPSGESDPNQGQDYRQSEEQRRNWGEWDDRPRSW